MFRFRFVAREAVSLSPTKKNKNYEEPAGGERQQTRTFFLNRTRTAKTLVTQTVVMKGLKGFARVGKKQGGNRRRWENNNNNNNTTSNQKDICEFSYLGPMTRKRAREFPPASKENENDQVPCCSYHVEPPASPQSCHSSVTTEHPEISTNSGLSEASEVETVDMKIDTNDRSRSRSRTRRKLSLRSTSGRKKHKTTTTEGGRGKIKPKPTNTTTTTKASSSSAKQQQQPSALDLIENFLGRCESHQREKQNKLAKKYNYDFEKDRPVGGGKFKWTPVKS